MTALKNYFNHRGIETSAGITVTILESDNLRAFCYSDPALREKLKEIMTEASKEIVLKTAKDVNPEVEVVIKYPNWYEHFQGLGFNLKDQPPLYEGIYRGNETRDAKLSARHLQ